MLTLFRYFTLIYSSAGRNVNRGVDVSVGGVATCTTLKFTLAFAVSFFAVSTSGASTGCVARIDCDNRDTVEFSFVGNKLPELGEGPPVHLGSLIPPEPYSVADTLEFFQGNPATGAFGVVNDPFRDHMIFMTAKPSFPIPEPLYGPPHVFSGPPLVLLVHLFPERTTHFIVLLPNGLDVLTTKLFAITRGCQVDHPKINADKFMDFNRCLLRQIDRTQQVELAASEYEVALSLEAVKSLSLVLSEDDGDNLAAFERKQTDAIHPFEAHQSLVIGHCSVMLKFRAFIVVSFEAFRCLPDSPNRHLAGQSEFFPEFPIASGMNRGDREDIGIKPDLSSVRGSRIELPHSCQQHPFLVRVGQDLNLQCEFHGVSLR